MEGGKNLTFLPHVLCLREMLKAPMFAPELAVGTFGPVSPSPLPAFDKNSLDELARLADVKAFALGGLDRSLCGRENCADLTRGIPADTTAPGDCLALVPSSAQPESQRPKKMPFNAFTARGLEGGLTARHACAP